MKIWRLLLNVVHNQLGIFIAPFIFVAAFTGLLYALTPQLEQYLYQAQLVAQHKIGQSAYPLSIQVQTAQKFLPSYATITEVRTSSNENATTRILYKQPTDQDTSTAIFINPYNLRMQGQLKVYGTSGVLPVRTFLDQMHRNLLLGEWGRIYSELAASWLGFFTLTGILQWWLKRQNIENSAHERHQYIRWHYLIALIILPMLLFFSLTGLTWSKWSGSNIAQIRHWINSDTPVLNIQLKGIDVQQAKAHIHAEHEAMNVMSEINHRQLNLQYFDDIIRIARKHGLMSHALQIKPSYRSDIAWVIQEMNHRYPIQVDALAVDMSQHRIIDKIHFEDFPLSAKLTRWGVDMHIGILFGWFNQLLLIITSFGILVLIIFAYRAWWSYQRPLSSIQNLNLQLSQLWQHGNFKLLFILACILLSLYFLVSVWVVSVILIQLIFVLGQLFYKCIVR